MDFDRRDRFKTRFTRIKEYAAILGIASVAVLVPLAANEVVSSFIKKNYQIKVEHLVIGTAAAIAVGLGINSRLRQLDTSVFPNQFEAIEFPPTTLHQIELDSYLSQNYISYPEDYYLNLSHMESSYRDDNIRN